MKMLDRVLQRWRIRQAATLVPAGCRLLDIGCADGLLGKLLRTRLAEYIGIDPDLRVSELSESFKMIAGSFPQALADERPFDVITMLAVLEHIPLPDQDALARDCAKYLRAGGRLILTVPSPRVDWILKALIRLRVADGMSLEQHSVLLRKVWVEADDGSRGEATRGGLFDL